MSRIGLERGFSRPRRTREPSFGRRRGSGAARRSILPAMKRAEKARRIQRMLDELYPAPPIPLAHENPFTLLVAVLLSAQTTDARVNLVTPPLFAEAPTPAAMSALGAKRILEHIKSLGLAPTKAKNLAKLSGILVREHDGRVPESFEQLEALPGVGHKTASVVMAQAFGQPAFPVDTHIQRLAARWGLSDGTSVERTERDLKALFPRESWNRLHLQIIYFGREHCPAIGHDLTQCPVCSWAATKKRIAAESRRRSAAARARSAAAREAADSRAAREPRHGASKHLRKNVSKRT